MGRSLEPLHQTLTDDVAPRAVCTVSLGRRFRVSNEPVKIPVRLSRVSDAESLRNVVEEKKCDRGPA
jgi:hypothetical protein